MEEPFAGEAFTGETSLIGKSLGQDQSVVLVTSTAEEEAKALFNPSQRDDATMGAFADISRAVKSNYIADLKKSASRVQELIHHQNVLRESIQQETTNFNEYRLTDDITEFVTELRNYHSKLKNMKKDIQYINDKVSKMKRRASKLRANKEKEERQIEENKRREQELQQQLTAKPAAESAERAAQMFN